MRRIPLIPTLLVVAAVAVMIRLGFWQLGRAEEKQALLAHYSNALTMSADAQWPRDAAASEAVLYRHTTIDCLTAGPDRPVAGHNADGETGWAHVFACNLGDGGVAQVVAGWSRDPALRQWSGGAVGGTIAPGPRLVADNPAAGLEPNARPDPRDLPDNHLSYAVQWFLFALTALVIYTLALRKRLAAKGSAG